MIQNIIFGIPFYIFIFVQTFQWTSSEFFLILDFLAESLKSNKSQQKRSHILQQSFAQKTSLILPTLTYLTLKIIYTRNTAKNFSDFTNSSANMFLFGVRKNISTALFLDSQKLHSSSTLETNVCIFLNTSIKKLLFQKRCKVLSGDRGRKAE